MFSGFLSTNCTDNALAAIRAAFHGCLPGDGGCDGSLVQAQEYERTENDGLADISVKLGNLATKYSVGTANMIQFAGAQAIVTCPLGSLVQTYAGRTDSSTYILSQFEVKSFSARDFVALLGAHSTAKKYFVDPSCTSASFDATPGQWDITYYGQMVTGAADGRALARQRQGYLWRPNMSSFLDLFVVDRVGRTIAFTPAWEKMALLGVEGGSSILNLIDCTGALPTLPAIKRESIPAPKSAFRKWW